MRRRKSEVVVLSGIIFLFWAGVVFGAPSITVPEKITKTWDMPPPDLQLDADKTLLPVGKGGIFVPCMTRQSLEPDYLVFQNGELLVEADSGSVVVVEPGTYTVKVGSGASSMMNTFEVNVKEGEPFMVLPRWSGLVIDVVDEKGRSFRGSYELVQLPERNSFGVGLGAEWEAGDELRTWLLKPGYYMIIKIGENYQARKNFYTFKMLPGYLEKMTLVMDEESEDFLGAGTLQFSDEKTTVSNWTVSAVMGGNVHISYRTDVADSVDGLSTTVGLFLTSFVKLLDDVNNLYIQLMIDESFTMPAEGEIQKTTDDAEFSAIYKYRFLTWLGPYIRGSVQTNLLPSYQYFSDSRDVKLITMDGAIHEYNDLENFQLSNSLFPLNFTMGLGLSTDFDFAHIFELSLRAGVGPRYVFTGNARVTDDENAKPVIFYERDDYGSFGLEGAVVAFLRLSRWVTISAELDLHDPFNDFNNPVMDLDINVGFRVSSFLSLNYILSMEYDNNYQKNAQWEHRFVLRFSYKLF